MKKIYILSVIVALSGILFTGCDNAEYEIKNNSVYLSDAAGSDKSVTLTMENGVDINVNVRLAKAVDRDVTIALKLNASLLEEYNKLNASEYNMIPNFSLPEGASVTIPAGEIGTVYKIRVDDFETNRLQYALPIELGEVLDGGVTSSVSQGRFIYLLAKPLIVSVPIMKGATTSEGKVRARPIGESWGINTAQWSLECWARMSAYGKNNQALFNTGSKDHEIYIRFGDANRPYNYLQIKTLGGQVQTSNPGDLDPNIWYHWAFVYDGTTLTIFQNGEEKTKFDPPAPKGGSVRFDYLEMISSGSYFINECGVSQVRLWKTAITQTQIKGNMYYSVNPNNPNLILYLPMDEGTGQLFNDVTGNGHDAEVGNAFKRWEHNVRFDK